MYNLEFLNYWQETVYTFCILCIFGSVADRIDGNPSESSLIVNMERPVGPAKMANEADTGSADSVAIRPRVVRI